MREINKFGISFVRIAKILIKNKSKLVPIYVKEATKCLIILKYNKRKILKLIFLFIKNGMRNPPIIMI
jgi:hypothetical protein